MNLPETNIQNPYFPSRPNKDGNRRLQHVQYKLQTLSPSLSTAEGRKRSSQKVLLGNVN